MNKTTMKVLRFVIVLVLSNLSLNIIQAQDVFDLQECLSYALENNHNLKKSKFDREKSAQARKEIFGSLLPQVNGSGSMSYNLKKAAFIMPNFLNDMLPPASQDPTAPKYLTIEMGTNYSAGLGLSLNQQLLNFSLFNAIEIAEIASKLAELGIESTEDEVIFQTAKLYYSIQSTELAAEQFDQNIALIDKMLVSMQSSYENGLIKKVDVDRLRITKVNLLTQQSAISNAALIQKNLLKLQMGYDMSLDIEIEEVDLAFFENKVAVNQEFSFAVDQMLPSLILDEQQRIGMLQIKSIKYESLPTLSLGLNYQHNFVSDEFFKGDTYYNYPSSMLGLNLRVPIFGGFSRKAKLKGAQIELQKIDEDARMLDQSLTMAYYNALLKLDDSKQTIEAQLKNMELAKEVYKISESNYLEGLTSMSDVLNANSSLVQSQLSYADALSKYMIAYIELRKANGSIGDLPLNQKE